MKYSNTIKPSVQAPLKPVVHGRSSRGLRVDLERAKELLIAAGYVIYPPRSRYELWRAYSTDSNAVAYRSGKIIAQGRCPEKVLEIISPAVVPEAGGQHDSDGNSLF